MPGSFRRLAQTSLSRSLGLHAPRSGGYDFDASYLCMSLVRLVGPPLDLGTMWWTPQTLAGCAQPGKAQRELPVVLEMAAIAFGSADRTVWGAD